MRTRVKFCGITRPADAAAAARAGADAIGLVFYSPSPRAVTVPVARDVVAALPPFVSVVGLFVNATHAEVQGVLDEVRLDLLQFHGEEPVRECERFARPYIKACRVSATTDIAAYARTYATATGLLLDAFQPGSPGGTGTTFDWTRIPATLATPVILAGGLTPDNVCEAIRQVRPYAVDVSGGIEASKGVKDSARMQRFMLAVASAND